MTLIFKFALLISFGIFVLPKRWKYAFGLVLHIMIIISSVSWAINALTNGAVTIDLGVSTWSGPIVLIIDPLSAFFILIINLICFCGIIYAGGYLRPYMPK